MAAKDEPMKGHVLGIDGGATKTDYALFDADGSMKGLYRGGGGNHECYPRGYDELACHLRSDIERLLGPHGLAPERITRSVFGMAGADFPPQYESLTRMFRSLGFVDFLVRNDAYLGVKAGTETGMGVCSVNGTGTCCAGVGPDGREVQLGGVGFICGDDGGSVSIGAMAIRHAYCQLYKCGAETRITQKLFSALGIATKESFLPVLYEQYLSRNRSLTDFCLPVFEAADEGDDVARGILRQVGASLGDTVVGAIRELGFTQPVEVVLSGPVYTRASNPELMDAMKARVGAGSPVRPTFRLLRMPPVAGAVLWALEAIHGVPLPARGRRRVLEAFEQ
jgi:N-acetylglucosamine kinase-like BadF-type ATPase